MSETQLSLSLVLCFLLASCAVKKRTEIAGSVRSKTAHALPERVLTSAGGKFLLFVSTDELQWGVENKIRYRVVTTELQAVDTAHCAFDVAYDMPSMPEMTPDGPYRPVSVTAVAPGEWEVLYDSLYHGGRIWQFRFTLKQDGKVVDSFVHEVLRP